MKWQNFTKSALLAFLLCSVSWTESLEIITEMLPSFIRIGQNITLTCIFESTIHIELRYLYVKWSREGQVVITFHSGHIEVNRTGAKLFTSVLEAGNASLFLPDVGIADEGEYQCYVFAPSSDKTASLKLQVAAPPQIVTSEDMTYASNDQNSVLSCDAMNFYPAELDISWKMVSEEEQTERGRRADMWKQGPILTPAGTYNIKTLLPLEVQEKDIQVKYICRIIHERSETNMEKIIHVQHVHVFPLKAISIFGIVFGSIVATIILGAAFHTFYKFCGNVSPELRELDGPVKDVKHGEEVKLSWQVNRYRPKDIEFEIFKGNQSLSFENKCADKDEEAVPLLPPKYKIEKSSPVQEASRLFSCKIDVSFTADILQDNNEIFLCELNHKALIKPIEKSIQLKVNGVPPEMDNIISPSAIFIGEPVVLTCTVSGYKPAPLVLTWFRQSNGENNSIVNWCQQDYYSNYSTSLMQMTPKLKNVGIEGERRGNYSHTATVLTHNDSSYTVTSNVTFIAQPMTKLVEYICKIFHPPTKHTEEKRITITNQDLLYLSSIWHHPVTMSALQPVILTCKVGNLYQRNVNIMWYKNRKFLKAEKLEAIAVNPNSFVLELELIPTSEDQLSQISCVIHDPDQHFTKESRCRLYLQAPPKMHPIECTPELPIPGNQVQLSCKATGFWPSDITYLWLEEGPSSQGTEWKNTCREHLGLPYCSPVGEQCKILSKLTPRPEIDKESLCSATSELIIVPCELDNYKKYRFVAFQPTTNQLFSKSFILNLKGFPAISSIECSSPEPVEGQPVTLRCRLLGFPSNKLSIQWCRDSEVLTEGISNTIPITNSDCLFGMETQLHINQLQPRDAKCKYICHVSHGTDWLSSRSIILQLQAHPILSSIRSEPAIPVLGQQIKIFCEIEGPITKYTSTWFKNGWEYKGAVITEKVEEEGISTIRGCIQFPATADNHMSEFRYQIQDEDGKHIEMRYFTLFIPGNNAKMCY
ncbi:uncharacterized protein LOC122797787 [Protopterus annectens]|uniref:uncharacterized protein LOC122797787 n=1 Tax=Protopterus annectens TaxID=7888 RepID=UPI001CFB49D4|nr:uncharacterized protein LOC122797787 [Protopterus annectens]